MEGEKELLVEFTELTQTVPGTQVQLKGEKARLTA